MENRAKNLCEIWPIPVHCNDRDEEKHQPEYHSSHHKERIQKQGVTQFLSCLGFPRTPHDSLLTPESVLCFHQRRKYGSYSMCVNLLAGNRTVSQRGGIIQETLHEKCPVLPLKPPVLIQMEESWMKNCLRNGNSLWEWIYEHREEFYERVHSNYHKEGAGALRKVDDSTLGELRNIFEVTGGKAFLDNIEQCSLNKAKEMGMDSENYFLHTYMDNNGKHQ